MTQEQVFQLITIIITTIIAPTALCFATGIIDLIKARVTSARLQNALADVNASVNTSYKVWAQKFAEEKERLSADGVFDATDLNTALREASISAANTLTASTISYLRQNNIEIVSYITDKIKAKLEEAKNE